MEVRVLFFSTRHWEPNSIAAWRTGWLYMPNYPTPLAYAIHRACQPMPMPLIEYVIYILCTTKAPCLALCYVDHLLLLPYLSRQPLRASYLLTMAGYLARV